MLVCSCLALLVPSLVRRKCKEGAIYSITRTRTQELISISIHFSRSICLFPLRPGFRPSYPLPAKANSSHSESNASLFLVSFPAPTKSSRAPEVVLFREGGMSHQTDPYRRMHLPGTQSYRSNRIIHTFVLLQAPRTQPSPFPGSRRNESARSDPNLTMEAPVSRSNFDVLPEVMTSLI